MQHLPKDDNLADLLIPLDKVNADIGTAIGRSKTLNSQG